MKEDCYNCRYSKRSIRIKGEKFERKFDDIYCSIDRYLPDTYCRLNMKCPFWEARVIFSYEK